MSDQSSVVSVSAITQEFDTRLHVVVSPHD